MTIPSHLSPSICVGLEAHKGSIDLATADAGPGATCKADRQRASSTNPLGQQRCANSPRREWRLAERFVSESVTVEAMVHNKAI
jgi:hypothetical protein